MTMQINRHDESGESILKQENQTSTPSGMISDFYRAMIMAGGNGSFLDTILEEDLIQELKIECFKLKKGIKGIFTGRMDPVALAAGTEAILQTLAAKKRSIEEKKQEDFTHQVDLAPGTGAILQTLAEKSQEDLMHQVNLAQETDDSSKKKMPRLGENEMLLEALFGHSGNPIALATGLEAVLQTLAIKVFAKEEAEEKVFNDDTLLALYDLDEKAKRFLKHPEMSFPLLSFVYTSRELLEEVKELKNYIHELDAFIRLQPNMDESRDSQLHNLYASKGTSSSK